MKYFLILGSAVTCKKVEKSAIKSKKEQSA